MPNPPNGELHWGKANLKSSPPTAPPPPARSLADVIADIRREHGDGVVLMMDQWLAIAKPSIPTGSREIDRLLGGGYPQGGLIELRGPARSGKTTLGLMAIREAQKFGVAVYVDGSMDFEIDQAEALGCDTSRLLLVRPASIEQAGQIIGALVEARVDLIVFDGACDLHPSEGTDAELAGAVSPRPREWSRLARKMSQILRDTSSTMLVLNQEVTDLAPPWPPRALTKTGNALHYYASTRLRLERDPMTGATLVTQLKGDGGALFRPISILLQPSGLNVEGA